MLDHPQMNRAGESGKISKCNSLRSTAVISLFTSLSHCLFLFFSFCSYDHNIIIAVGAYTINDVALWVRPTVSASTDPSGSNQSEREHVMEHYIKYYLNLKF